MIVNLGANYIFGTNNDNFVNVKGDIFAAWRYSNVIDFANGNDNITVGGRIVGSGQNTIKGRTGNKVVSIAGGVDATWRANNSNEIIFNGASGDRRSLTLNYVRSADSGRILFQQRKVLII